VVENAHLNDGDSDRHDNENEKVPLTGEEETKEETVEPSDEPTTHRQRLEEEQAKSAEYLDGWQRARAELANARKRWERESVQTYNHALVDTVARLLPVVDDFERAIATLPDNLSGLTWIDGVLLIYRNLGAVLEQQGVVPIEAGPGIPFDPSYHQAITHEPHDAYEAGAIIGEFQKGYKLGDRVVRPALVRVSSGPPPDESESPETAE
jgi:molecular chaperone GrpE